MAVRYFLDENEQKELRQAWAQDSSLELALVAGWSFGFLEFEIGEWYQDIMDNPARIHCAAGLLVARFHKTGKTYEEFYAALEEEILNNLFLFTSDSYRRQCRPTESHIDQSV